MTNKRSSLILLLVGILVIYFTWSFFIPRVNEVWQAKNNLERERLRLENLKIKLGDLEGLNEFELSSRTQLSLQAVPAEKDFIGVLRVLGKLATDQGLVVESFQVTPGELSLKEKSKLVFKISLVGNIEAIKLFLEKIEKILPLVNVVGGVKINLTGEIAAVDLNVENYFIPLPTTLGILEVPIAKLTPAEEKALASLTGFTSFPAEAIVPQATGRTNPFAF